jgi:hypothetical protein
VKTKNQDQRRAALSVKLAFLSRVTEDISLHQRFRITEGEARESPLVMPASCFANHQK